MFYRLVKHKTTIKYLNYFVAVYVRYASKPSGQYISTINPLAVPTIVSDRTVKINIGLGLLSLYSCSSTANAIPLIAYTKPNAPIPPDLVYICLSINKVCSVLFAKK